MAKQKPTEPPASLRYIGDGSALDNVPARDLRAEEVAALDWQSLLASGLYALPEPSDTTPQQEA